MTNTPRHTDTHAVQHNDQEQFQGHAFIIGTSDRYGAVLIRQDSSFWLQIDDRSPQPVALTSLRAGESGSDHQLYLLTNDGQSYCFILPASHYPTLPLSLSLLGGQPAGARAITAVSGWFSKSWLIAIIGLFLMLASIIAIYRLVLPGAAQRLSVYVPSHLERQIGAGVLQSLEKTTFTPSNLTSARQAEIQAIFLDLRDIAGLDDEVEMLLRGSPRLGPNALALPGGPIIILDELVDIAPSDAALASVIAHELAHVQARHSLQLIIRQSLILIGAQLLLGAEDSLVDQIILTGLNLSVFSQSREHEREADALSKQWMAAWGDDGTGAVQMFTALKEACGPKCEAQPELLSTHPSLDERIETARDN